MADEPTRATTSRTPVALRAELTGRRAARSRCRPSSRRPTAACSRCTPSSTRRPQQLREATELKSRFLSYMSHEFRTPINVDPQPRAPADRPRRRPADRGAGASRSASSSRPRPSSPRWSTTCSTWPRSRPAASRSRRSGSRWSTCSRRCAACSSRCSTNPDVMLIFEEPHGQPRAVHRRPQAVADPAQLHLERAQVHAEGRGARLGRAERRRHRSRSRSPTPASASRRSSTHAIFQDFAQIESPIQKRLRGTGLGPVAEQAPGRAARRHGRR